MSEILHRLRDAVASFDVEGVRQASREALEADVPAYQALVNGLAEGMNVVGEKFEAGECFLLDLIMAGEAMNAGLEILEPYLKAGEIERSGRVVIGTVKGDLHDVGKNIVIAMLKSAGFDLIDLGVDVAPDKFVEIVRKERPNIVGMSSLITPSMPAMDDTIRFLERANVRGEVKVIVGGAPLTREYAEKIKADAFAKDAVEGVHVCKRWLESR